MSAILAWAGPAVVAGAWLMVRSRRLSVWAAMAPTFAVLAALAVATGKVQGTGDVHLAAGVGAGAAGGLALYAATVVLANALDRWPGFAGQVAEAYGRRGHLSVAASLALSILIVVPGEELLFRGVVQSVAADAVGELPGALVAWGAYASANLASGSAPVILGAVGPGAVWGAVALWTGGVAAGLACHAVWTGLMIARPPKAGRQ